MACTGMVMDAMVISISTAIQISRVTVSMSTGIVSDRIIVIAQVLMEITGVPIALLTKSAGQAHDLDLSVAEISVISQEVVAGIVSATGQAHEPAVRVRATARAILVIGKTALVPEAVRQALDLEVVKVVMAAVHLAVISAARMPQGTVSVVCPAGPVCRGVHAAELAVVSADANR